MQAASAEFDGAACHISRSGYTGEDGFEISVRAERVEAVARALLAEPEVKPIGLGARDSLRLEAGLCLYGHDIDTTTSPVEAALAWSIGKRRRIEGGFPGADRVRLEIENGPSRRRVGLVLDGKVPAREGADIKTPEGILVGRVTSGGFSPTLGGPIAMGYVEIEHTAPATALDLVVRGRPLPAHVARLPFVPHRYHKEPQGPLA
jgi:aminomethyltransferase